MVTESIKISGMATPSSRRHAFEPVTRPSVVTQAATGAPVRTTAVWSASMITASGTSTLSSDASLRSAPAYAPSASVSTMRPTSSG